MSVTQVTPNCSQMCEAQARTRSQTNQGDPVKATSKLFLVSAFVVASGCRVSKPGAAETRVAEEVKHRMTVVGKDVLNPLPATEENIAEGREHFGHHCGICHGLDGQSSGVPFADKMSPPVPNLASKDVQDYADGQLKWIIDDGINPSGMPAWRRCGKWCISFVICRRRAAWGSRRSIKKSRKSGYTATSPCNQRCDLAHVGHA